MGYTVFCCICKRDIELGVEKFVTCQPTAFENGEWKRVRLGKWKQFCMCLTCLNEIIEIKEEEREK